MSVSNKQFMVCGLPINANRGRGLPRPVKGHAKNPTAARQPPRSPLRSIVESIDERQSLSIHATSDYHLFRKPVRQLLSLGTVTNCRNRSQRDIERKRESVASPGALREARNPCRKNPEAQSCNDTRRASGTFLEHFQARDSRLSAPIGFRRTGTRN